MSVIYSNRIVTVDKILLGIPKIDLGHDRFSFDGLVITRPLLQDYVIVAAQVEQDFVLGHHISSEGSELIKRFMDIRNCRELGVQGKPSDFFFVGEEAFEKVDYKSLSITKRKSSAQDWRKDTQTVSVFEMKYKSSKVLSTVPQE